MMRKGSRAILSLALACFALGCESSDPFERSCAGKALEVPLCRPYEYAILQSGSVTPELIRVGDPTASVRVQASLRRCAQFSGTLEVRVEARVSGSTPVLDGGMSSERIVSLVTVRDDGELGDATANDGIVDVTVPNPFSSETIPANSTVTLRLVPVTSACEGRTFETPYRTGAAWNAPRL